jgi:hypothetical protein
MIKNIIYNFSSFMHLLNNFNIKIVKELSLISKNSLTNNQREKLKKFYYNTTEPY